jgi:hypothetical protein
MADEPEPVQTAFHSGAEYGFLPINEHFTHSV